MKNKLALLPLLSGIVATSSAFAADPLSNFGGSVSAYVGAGPATTVVYNVPTGGANFLYSSANEFGDQVSIVGGAGQVVSSISFEYYANYALAGGLSFNVYKNDGPGGSPLTSIDTRTLDITDGGGIKSVDFTYNAANVLPESFTYTVKFSGIGGANEAGLIVPNSLATIGSSANDLWEKTGGVWATKQVVIPEPSTVALFSVAGVAFAGALFGRRNRK